MTLYHPTIPGVTATVSKRAVRAWLEQGWRKTPPAQEPTD